MLRKLRIRNFRSLRDTGELEVRRLNLLVGPNSSGKTSLFKIFLALKETVEGQPVSAPLQPKGYFANIGNYKEFVWNHNERYKVGLKVVEERNEFEIEWGVFISGKSKGKIYLNRLHASFSRGAQRRIVEIQKHAKKPIHKVKIDNRVEFNAHIESLGKGIEVRNKKLQFNDLRTLLLAFESIFNFTRKIFYIAPLRLEPQRVYESFGIEPNYVGKRGERVIDALIAHREKLEPWIKEWLERFGMAKDFKVEEIAKGTRRFQIMLHDSHIPKLEATLADVGFGISQVLPILVQAKLLPKDAIFMVEQPEIHLHPKAQAAMGDFLIDVALEGKKTLLVETHSDLVIARIANRIAEGKISHKDVMVFYFHPQKDGTKILQIEFDEDGIPTHEFPEGFLAEVSDETARHFDILSRR